MRNLAVLLAPSFAALLLTSCGSGDEPATTTAPTEGTGTLVTDKIAFASTRDRPRLEIYVMNADGSDQTNLTDTVGDDLHPAWSPDGTHIAFESDREGNDEIYVMNADGSGQANLTNNSADDRFPTWSPDGTRVAFYSNRDGNFEIYVTNIDGSGVTRLTDEPKADKFPAWSSAP